MKKTNLIPLILIIILSFITVNQFIQVKKLNEILELSMVNNDNLHRQITQLNQKIGQLQTVKIENKEVEKEREPEIFSYKSVEAISINEKDRTYKVLITLILNESVTGHTSGKIKINNNLYNLTFKDNQFTLLEDLYLMIGKNDVEVYISTGNRTFGTEVELDFNPKEKID